MTLKELTTAVSEFINYDKNNQEIKNINCFDNESIKASCLNKTDVKCNKNLVNYVANNISHNNSNNYNEKIKKEKCVSISKTNIYIRGLGENTSDQDLYEMCSKLVI